MAQLPINYGAAANDGTGTNWRTAFQRIQDNFTDIYSLQSRIVSAGDVRFSGEATTEAKVQAAINQAVTELATAVFVPSVMMPYDASLVTFNGTVRMVREGGDFSVFDVRAYGADPTGVLDAGPAWNATRAAVPATGGPMRASFGTYNLTTAFTFSAQENVTLIIDPGTSLTGEALPVPDEESNNTILDYRSGFDFTGAINVTGPANLPTADITEAFCRASVGGGDFLGVAGHTGQANLWAVGMGNEPEEQGVLVLRRARLDGNNAPAPCEADDTVGIIKFGGFRGDPGGGGSPFVTTAEIHAVAQVNWTTATAHTFLLFSITDHTNVRKSAFEIRSSGTANDIWLRVYDWSAQNLVRVSRGASDSGGVGFRLLRVPN